MPIRILAPEVANQIAAGEVVERPASAVKELLENSLDAGASDIRVEIREGGRRLIRVQDDGSGIPAGEAALAFQRHATSKIASAADLNRITTLGFRGEALASIAAVAHVTLLTRTREEEAGTQIRMISGEEAGRSLQGTPPGTSVTVEHLFANVPARLKFLKQPATEAAHIQQVVTRYALAYPERRFSLMTDGKLVLQSAGNGKLYDVIVKVYGLEMARQMLPIEPTGDGRSLHRDDAAQAETVTDLSSHLAVDPSRIFVTGYTGAPGLHRSNRGYITLFVNRRWFQDSSVSYAVIQAYHTMLPVGRYPLSLIFIEMDPGDVDVNVHPTKAEVRFREPNAVFASVQRAVRRSVIANAPIPSAGPFEARQRADMPQGSESTVPTVLGGVGWAERRDALLGAGRVTPALTPAGDAQWSGSDRTLWSPERDLSEGGEAAERSQTAQEMRAGLVPILRVVGQLAATYIVAEGPDGLYLIDQHAAHERVLYEQMLADHAANRLAVQPMLEPLVLDLSPEQGAVAAEELETLNELGVAIEPFGGSSYVLRSVPAILSREDPRGALVEILDGLARQIDLVETTNEAHLVTLICKRAAVKGGITLSMAEMEALVRRLEACRSPRTCPHGRPTIVFMSATDLARQFRRS